MLTDELIYTILAEILVLAGVAFLQAAGVPANYHIRYFQREEGPKCLTFPLTA